MKILNCFLLLSIFFLNFIFGSLQSRNDGWDIIGFPFVFYKNTDGKLNVSEYIKTSDWFSLKYFCLDIFIYMLVIVTCNYLYKKLLMKGLFG